VAEDGDFDILIGVVVTSAPRRRLRAGHAHAASLLDATSTVREWIEDPRGAAVSLGLFQQMMTQMGAHGGAIHRHVDMMGFIMEMPMASVLSFKRRCPHRRK
jgi:beta-glucosidase